MTTIDGGGAIERYIPAGDIASRQAAELALVGLSSNFPAIVTDLNETLQEAIDSPFGYGSFRGYRFTLQPDPNKPSVGVEESRSFPFEVTVDADLLQRATFSVRDRIKSEFGQGTKTLNWVKLDAIADFVADYPSNHNFRFRSDGCTEPSNLNLSALEVDDSLVERLRDDVNSTFGLRLEFEEDEHTGLTLPLRFATHAGRSALNFGVSEIVAKAPCGEIEAIIGSYCQLLMVKYEEDLI